MAATKGRRLRPSQLTIDSVNASRHSISVTPARKYPQQTSAITMLTTSQALALAVQHHQAGEFEPAEKLYRAVLRIDSGLAGVHYNLGSVLQKRNRLDEAIEAYRRALEIDPHDSTGHRALGTALKACDRLAEAAECFRRALVLRPDYAEAHNNLGNTLQELGDVPEAIESYRCRSRST
jgi:tetratricopeptide (TPR) repeat protein